ncbi:MAG: MBL fold metallo-hydrolase [Oscillospiraceae bacterium]|nr:MBL fold metallo-hydrolase [Oscillospiraceae bacterium]
MKDGKENRGRAAKKIATIIVMGGMVLIFLFDITVNLLCNHYERRWLVRAEDFRSIGAGASRLHFLNVDNADCILLESAGHFALIDSGWGSDNPIASARRPGYEARVLAYLKQVAADRAGRVTLDFILPTHYHYDHAGGFPAILSDPAVTVKEVFLKPLGDQNQFRYELDDWGIGENRQRIADIAAARGFPVVETLPDKPFALGDMTLQLLNLDSHDDPRLKGENDNSVVTLVRVFGRTALLTGDITAPHGLEKKIARETAPLLPGGRLDLLKLPHHGYSLSTSVAFLRRLRPKMGIVTNGLGQIYPNVKWNVALAARMPVYSTARENGVIVTILPTGNLSLSGNLHLGN